MREVTKVEVRGERLLPLVSFLALLALGSLVRLELALQELTSGLTKKAFFHLVCGAANKISHFYYNTLIKFTVSI